MAGAEVVDRQADAHGTAAAPARSRARGGVGHHDRLGDLQFERRRRRPELAQQPGDVLAERRPSGWPPTGSRPRAAVAGVASTRGTGGRVLEHPHGERTDQARRSASGMNSAGGSRPRVGWFQRTRASTPTRLRVGQRDLWLEVEDQLIALDYTFWSSLSHQQAVGVGVSAPGVVDLKANVQALGLVHGHVRALQEQGGGLRVRGTAPARQSPPPAPAGPRPRRASPVAVGRDPRLGLGIVSPSSGRRRIRPRRAGPRDASSPARGGQPGAHLLQQRVARLVAQRVVYLLEVVQVQAAPRRRDPPPPRRFTRSGECGTVGQPGECVVGGVVEVLAAPAGAAPWKRRPRS